MHASQVSTAELIAAATAHFFIGDKVSVVIQTGLELASASQVAGVSGLNQQCHTLLPL